MKDLIKKVKDGLEFASTSERESKLYYGFELEFDGQNATLQSGDTARYIRDALREADIKSNIVSDGSLDYGLEVVLHPCTYSVITDRGATFTKIFRRLQQAGYNNNNEKAGGHIHISRRTLGKSKDKQRETIDNIIAFFLKHRLAIRKYSRRASYNFEQWCKILDSYNYPTQSDMNARYPHNRYQAVNLCNKNTIEFRFFMAPTSHSEMLANFQLVKCITKGATSRHRKLSDYATLDAFIRDHAKTNKELMYYWDSL